MKPERENMTKYRKKFKSVIKWQQQRGKKANILKFSHI